MARIEIAQIKSNLKQGSRGGEVEKLQVLLGLNATGFYGTQTQAAVEKFQIEHGIAKKSDPGFGQVGPRTIAKVQEVFSSDAAILSGVESSLEASEDANTAKVASPTKVAIPVLAVGSRESEVQIFQKVLGVNPTGFFGPITKKAVEDFQIEHGIAKQGDPGFGQIGPLTRAKVQEIFPDAQIPDIVPTPSPAASASTPSSPASSASTPISQSSTPTTASGSTVHLGQRNLAVQEVQRDLIELGYLKSGYDTGFYGTLTEAAVKQFQCKNDIVCSGTPDSTGWGLAGPKTRGVLNGMR